MKTSHRLATSLAAAAAVAAAVVAPTTGEASYSSTSQAQAASVESAMSSAAGTRTLTKRRLSIRTSGMVTVGDELLVTGRTSLRRALVRLQVNQSGRWRRIDRTRTSAHGTFRTSEVVTREGEHRFRVVVSPRRGHDATASFRVSAVPRATGPTGWPTEEPTALPTATPVATWTPVPTTTPTPTAPPVPVPTSGAGNAADWSYITGGTEAIAWNSCSVITWGYSPAGEYAGARDDWARAFDLVAQRSGLSFEYAGTDGAIDVSWSDAAAQPRLAGSVVGFGGPSYRYIDPDANDGVSMLITGGRVVLDRESPLSPGHATTGGAAWGQVMVHELMHAVGLGHAAGREQIMYPSTGALFLGAGDHTGLYNVGSSRGCLSSSQYADPAPGADGGGEVLVHDRLGDLS